MTPPAIPLTQPLVRQGGTRALRLVAPTRDELIVARIRGGESEAFAELVEPYLPGLERLLRPLAREPESVEDLVQDALLRALRNLDRFRGGKFSTWLYRVGMNLSLTTARRQTVGRRLLDPAGPLAQARSELPPSPMEVFMQGEDVARMRAAIKRLPMGARQVIELRYGRDLSCKEIAEELGKTANAVSLTLFRARQRLRDELEGRFPS